LIAIFFLLAYPCVCGFYLQWSCMCTKSIWWRYFGCITRIDKWWV